MSFKLPNQKGPKPVRELRITPAMLDGKKIFDVELQYRRPHEHKFQLIGRLEFDAQHISYAFRNYNTNFSYGEDTSRLRLLISQKILELNNEGYDL